MGNSVQAKKKVRTEENSPVRPSSSPQRVKSKGSWLFGRRDKVKTGKRNPGGQLGSFSIEGKKVFASMDQLVQCESVFAAEGQGSREMSLQDSFIHVRPFEKWAFLLGLHVL